MRYILGVACVFCSKLWNEQKCPMGNNSRELSYFFCSSYERAEQFNDDKEIKETVFDVVYTGEILDD
jgi:hypothetical protein